METEHDIWFYFGVLVSAVALFVWALWALIGLGGAWIPLAMLALIMLSLGSIALHTVLMSRSVVRTPHLREAHAWRARQLTREAARGVAFILAVVAVIRLVGYHVLPEWTGIALLLVLLAAWIFLKRAARRSSV